MRLGRCNLDCSWCDTSYTWDWSGKNGVTYDPKVELHTMTIGEIAEAVAKLDVDRVVVSGGEPLLQRNLAEMIRHLDNYYFEIETNGTRAIDIREWHRGPEVQFNVSPKLTGSGVARAKAWIDGALGSFLELSLRDSTAVVWKFVVGTEQDIDDVDAFVARYKPWPPTVWLMHQTPLNGVDVDVDAVWVASAAIERGFNYTSRLHVGLWGNERGR